MAAPNNAEQFWAEWDQEFFRRLLEGRDEAGNFLNPAEELPSLWLCFSVPFALNDCWQCLCGGIAVCCRSLRRLLCELPGIVLVLVPLVAWPLGRHERRRETM